MSKMFQINEEDLAALESELPKLLDRSMEACNDTKVRMKWRRVKDILSNVRWDYGPPSDVSSIPFDDIGDLDFGGDSPSKETP